MALQFIYFGTAPIEERNLSCLAGYHEAFLGSALSLHANGAVAHWTDYFRQNWADFLYHDESFDFIKEIKGSIMNHRGVMVMMNKILLFGAGADDDQVDILMQFKI